MEVFKLKIRSRWLILITMGLFGMCTHNSYSAPIDFPYVDVNNNSIWDSGDIGKPSNVDILKLINNDGVFDTAIAEPGYVPPINPASLIIPVGVSIKPIKEDKLFLSAGHTLQIRGKISLPKTNTPFTFMAGEKIDMANSEITAGGNILFVTTGANSVINLNYSKIISKDGNITVQSANDVSFYSGYVLSSDFVKIESVGNVLAEKLKVKTLKKNIYIHCGVLRPQRIRELNLKLSSLQGFEIFLRAYDAKINLHSAEFINIGALENGGLTKMNLMSFNSREISLINSRILGFNEFHIWEENKLLNGANVNGHGIVVDLKRPVKELGVANPRAVEIYVKADFPVLVDFNESSFQGYGTAFINIGSEKEAYLKFNNSKIFTSASGAEPTYVGQGKNYRDIKVEVVGYPSTIEAVGAVTNDLPGSPTPDFIADHVIRN